MGWIETTPILFLGILHEILFCCVTKAFLTFRNLQTITRPQYQCSCKPLSFRKCKSFSLNNCFMLVNQSPKRKQRCGSFLLSDNTTASEKRFFPPRISFAKEWKDNFFQTLDTTFPRVSTNFSSFQYYFLARSELWSILVWQLVAGPVLLP